MRRELIDIVLACFAAGTLATHAASQDADYSQPTDTGAEIEGLQPESTGLDSLDEPFEFGPFTEPLDITAFVTYVANTLKINVSRDTGLTGQVAFNTGVQITKRDLLPLLDARLEELGYTITLDSMGFYSIIKSDKVTLGGPETTKFISTPGVRPSSLQRTISTQLGVPVQQGNQGGGVRISYEDELGVIIITDSPRRIAAVESLIADYLAQRASLVTHTIPLMYVSAPIAKLRAEQLLSSETGSGTTNQFNNDPNQTNTQSGGSGSLSNRLTVDASGNNLLFRGLEEEFDEILALITAVDQQSQLDPVAYITGSSTRAIAEFAEKMGYGEVDFTSTTASTASPQNQGFRQAQNNNQAGLNNQEPENSGGSRLLADEGRGRIIYFGTPSQHESFEALVSQLNAADEEIVVEIYKLNYAHAADVADILQSLIERSRPQTESNSFLPAEARQFRNFFNPNNQSGADESSGSAGFNPNPDTSFVIADEGNSQIIITSPRQQQREFADLIRRIDLRRPQVYIEAIIVAVSDTDSFRLAIESQFLDFNSSGEGGGLRTNYGLSTLDLFSNATAVATGLGGITAALVKDDFVPFIINATETDSNSRVIARPQLLVDDNSEASVLTSQEVPFQTSLTDNSTTRTTFEFATAETSLTVTPQISAGGTIRLDYQVLLEAFNGAAANGAPPPKQTNEIRGESVTVPSDSTVVIGGLVVESEGKTIIKVPFFGDIPIIGHLINDTSTDARNTTLYVFLKPRVLRNPSKIDYDGFTRGPQSASGIEFDIPEFPPIVMTSTYFAREEDGVIVIDDGSPRIGLPSETNPDLDQHDLKRDND